MNLTMNTEWSQIDHRSYLIVSVSADDTARTTASQIYLDIELPKGVRVRHMGNLPSDGHGNSIGLDLPDLAAGAHQNIVFRIASRASMEESIAPELHLHWIDSSSGDLLERHQTASPLPTEPIGVNADLVEIVANARSERKRTRRRESRHESIKENTSLMTEQFPHYRRNYRRRNAMLHRTVAQMQEQVNELEQRMRRMQRKARFHAMNTGEQTEVRKVHHERVRTRRESGSSRIPTRGHRSHRWHGEGRRMGRMMHRAFAASRECRDDRQHEM